MQERIIIIATKSILSALSKSIKSTCEIEYVDRNAKESLKLHNVIAIIDLTNYDLRGYINSTHNQKVVTTMLDLSKEYNFKYIFGFQKYLFPEDAINIGYAIKQIQKYNLLYNLNNLIIEIGDVYGRYINTSDELNQQLKCITNNDKYLKIKSENTEIDLIHDSDFLNAINYIINEINNIKVTEISITNPETITEFELAYNLKSITNANYIIKNIHEYEDIKDGYDLLNDAVILHTNISFDNGIIDLLRYLKIQNNKQYLDNTKKPIETIHNLPSKQLIETRAYENYKYVGNKPFNSQEIISKNNLQPTNNFQQKINVIEEKIHLNQQTKTFKYKERLEKNLEDLEKQYKKQYSFTKALIASLIIVTFSAFFINLSKFYYWQAGRFYLSQSVESLQEREYSKALEQSEKSIESFNNVKEPTYFIQYSLKLSGKSNSYFYNSLNTLKQSSEYIKNTSYVYINLKDSLNDQKEDNIFTRPTLLSENIIRINRIIDLQNTILQKNTALKQESTILYSIFIGNSVKNVHIEKNQLVQLRNIIPIIGKLLGYEKEQNYLVAILNNQTPSPVGGEIIYYSTLNINKGNFTVENFKKAFEFDDVIINNNINIIPVKEMREDLNVNRLYFTNVIWDPDFRKIAKNSIKLYSETFNEPLDGVIYINANHLFNLNEKLYLEQDAEPKLKDTFVEEVFDKFTNDLNINDADTLINHAQLIYDSLNNKNILVYHNNEEIEKVMINNNWAATLKNTNNDYLYVLDTVFEGTKKSNMIVKDVTYNPEYSNNTLKRKVNVKYSLSNDFEDIDTNILANVKIIIPQFINIDKFVSINENTETSILQESQTYSYLDKVIVSTNILIEKNKESEIMLEYSSKTDKLPDKLYIQKQPLRQNESFHLIKPNNQHINLTNKEFLGDVELNL